MEIFIYKLAYKEKDTPCILKGLEALTYWHGGSFRFLLTFNTHGENFFLFEKKNFRSEKQKLLPEYFPARRREYLFNKH